MPPAAPPVLCQEVSANAMTVSDDLSLPIAIALAVGLGLLALWVIRGLRAAGSERDTAQVIAAVQGERDVLRAKHAVEVAELEGKIEEMNVRLQEGLTRSTQLQDAGQTIQGLTAERDDARGKVEAAETALERLRRELDTQTSRARDVPQLLSDRDRARTQVVDLTETLDELRRELHEANNKANRAAADLARRADGDGTAGIIAERDAARADADAAIAQVEQLQSQLGLMETAGADGAADSAEYRNEIARLSTTITEQQELISSMRSSEAGGGVDPDTFAAAQAEAREANSRADAANEQLSRLSYELDGLRARVTNAERGDRVSRNEVEKRDALLELRLQRIHELETKLREQHGQLHGALRRAETAEETTAAIRAGEIDEAEVAEAADLRVKLDEARERNRVLMEELDAAQTKAAETDIMGGDAPASATAEKVDLLNAEVAALSERNTALEAEQAPLKARIAELESEGAPDGERVSDLERENQRLRELTNRQDALHADTVAELKTQLRDMAERFAAGAPPPEPVPEPSLKDRIRAYKASKTND